MADISTDELTKEIHAVLKTADLSVVSAKKVREQVEKKLGCSLMTRKKEFDTIVMDFINSQQDDEDSGEEEDGDDDKDASEEAPSSEEEKKPAKKRPQPTPRKISSKKKRKSINASDSGTESDGKDDSDFEVRGKKKRAAAPAPKKKKKAAGTGGPRKSTGFTRAYNLSPELSELMGAEALPRHEVVKKVWALIKERNLYDPKNKQYAICDDELMKVMKVKRFRTFGMLKHLKPHFLLD